MRIFTSRDNRFFAQRRAPDLASTGLTPHPQPGHMIILGCGPSLDTFLQNPFDAAAVLGINEAAAKYPCTHAITYDDNVTSKPWYKTGPETLALVFHSETRTPGPRWIHYYPHTVDPAQPETLDMPEKHKPHLAWGGSTLVCALHYAMALELETIHLVGCEMTRVGDRARACTPYPASVRPAGKYKGMDLCNLIIARLEFYGFDVLNHSLPGNLKGTHAPLA